MNEENNQEPPDTSGVDVEATPSPATDEIEVMPPLEEASDEKHSLTLNSGTYEVEWISPINSDGSIYTAPEKANLLVPTVSKDTADPDKVSTTSKFKKIPAENVSSDDLNKILVKAAYYSCSCGATKNA